MITLQNITKIYSIDTQNQVVAVDNVDLEISPGEFVMITGRSGSGKTTLLNLIAGLTSPTSGKVLMDGKDIWALNDQQRSFLRNQKMGFIFQFPSLIPSLTVLENVMLPTIFAARGSLNHVADRASSMLETVGLEKKLSSYPRQLSAGQQQRVVIARSLINSPEIILADEPTSDLDEKTELEIMELFCEIHARSKITFIMVTHTSQLVRYGTRSIEVASGKIAK